MIIRDCVHGDIYLTKTEQAVLDTPQMQRLRGIKQLGTSNMVYPGCVHTRFEHSLGTLAMAKTIMHALEHKGFDLNDTAKTEIAIAALIHDVTHIPFGHTFEDERKIFPRHDNKRRFEHFLRDGALGDVLKAHGLEGVLDILTGNVGVGEKWKSQIISSTIDADLLDYLRRDAYFTGLTQGYDDRIFSYFGIHEGQLCMEMTKHQMERPDARSEIMNLLRLRYFLTERVYYHHAKIVAGAMIAKAVELASCQGLVEQDLYNLTDETLLDLLARYPSSEHPDSAISELVGRVIIRNLFKRAYVLSGATLGRNERLRLIDQHGHPGRQRELAEREIAEALGIPPHQVIIYCPGSSSMKEVEVITLTNSGLRKMNEPRLNPPLDIKVLEDQYEALWRFYIFAPQEHVIKANKVCAEYFGFKNEHLVPEA